MVSKVIGYEVHPHNILSRPMVGSILKINE